MYEKELKELETKHPPGDPDPDSLEDLESALMDCDHQEKMEFSEDRLFRVRLVQNARSILGFVHSSGDGSAAGAT